MLLRGLFGTKVSMQPCMLHPFGAWPAIASHDIWCMQTRCAKTWCIGLLTNSLNTVLSCFIILEAAVQAGIPSLVEHALNTACSSFSNALIADSVGWRALSQAAVLLVLCSDKLQVCLYSARYRGLSCMSLFGTGLTSYFPLANCCVCVTD